MTYILALDIGGTNPRIAMVQLLGKNNFKVIEKTRITDNVNSLIEPINNFLKDLGEKNITTDTCCISIACPVENNTCSITTNSKFSANYFEIKNNTMLKNILIINDFEAIGTAVASMNILDAINNKTIIEIKKGIIKESNNRIVIGPGTGLGISYIPYINELNKYVVLESEGGHVPLFYRKNLSKLISKVIEDNNQERIIGTESIVSGQGIKNIAKYFLTNKDEFNKFIQKEENYKNLIEEIKEYDSKQEMTNNILLGFLREEQNSQNIDFNQELSRMQDINYIARVTMNLFIEFLAYSCQSAALNGYSKGGVFLAGGILPKNETLLLKSKFEDYFSDNWKSVLVDLLKTIPVYLITDYDISFIGCAKCAEDKFNLY